MNKKVSFEVFEYNKKSSLNFIKSQGERLGRWEEKLLSSNYWKNWQAKIQEFQDQDEMDFYVDRLSALIDFIFNNGQPVSDLGLIQQEEQRLQNISLEDFKKEDKFSNVWEELDAKWVQESLEKTKSGSISYLKEIDRLTRWDIYHAHWETYLTTHAYWNSWQEKIKSFQTKKEVSFYTDRLRAFKEFVEDNTRKDISSVEGIQQWNPLKTPQLIDWELKRLEHISEEEFNQTDKWRKEGPIFKELSVEEMLNDKWFNEQFFGSEERKPPKEEEKPVKGKSSKKDSDSNTKEVQNELENERDNVDYKNWTNEQLIAEINRLKAENEALKNDQTLTNSEKENRIKQNQQALEKLESNILNSSNSNVNNNKDSGNLGVGVLIGGGAIALIVGAIAYSVLKPKKIKK